MTKYWSICLVISFYVVVVVVFYYYGNYSLLNYGSQPLCCSDRLKFSWISFGKEYQVEMTIHVAFYLLNMPLEFSSPEPKAPEELI